jgi:hypothetical protein
MCGKQLFLRNVRENYCDLVDNLLTLCQLVLDRKTMVCKDAATHCKNALLLLQQEVRILAFKSIALKE